MTLQTYGAPCTQVAAEPRGAHSVPGPVQEVQDAILHGGRRPAKPPGAAGATDIPGSPSLRLQCLGYIHDTDI